jgi:hypothetical protein
MSCNTPKKEKKEDHKEVSPVETIEKEVITEKKEIKKDNELIVVLNNPKAIEGAKALITNSGLSWNDLNLDVKGIKSAIITVPTGKKEFWIQRLLESNTFETVETNNEETLKSIKNKLENRLISIRKTQCFGDCPVYDFYINKDGKSFFNGKKYVVKEGKHEFQLSEKELQQLTSKIETSNFNSFKDVYDNPKITDLASSYIFCDGKQVQIRLWQNIPDGLIDVHEYATEFLYTKKFLE